MLEQALTYAARNWPIFKLSRSKVPFKGSHGHLDATTDPNQVRAWWNTAIPVNIGLACGGIVVLDLDSPQWMTSVWGRELKTLIDQHGLPATRLAATRRGVHIYFTSPPGVEVRVKNERRVASGDPGVDIKGAGGYVMLPPSVSNGFTYQWLNDLEPAVMPDWLITWIGSLGAARTPLSTTNRPAYLQQSAAPDLVQRARQALRDDFNPAEIDKLRSALQTIPADGYDDWYQVGMALHGLGWERSDGTSQAFDLWDEWSRKSQKYAFATAEEKWASFDRSSRGDISIGTVFYLAKQRGWIEPRKEVIPPDQVQHTGTLLAGQSAATFPQTVNGYHGPIAGSELIFSPKSGDPLIELNNKFCVIGNLGGKCVVLGWQESSIDHRIKIPYFQTFRSFSERYGNRYVTIPTEKKNKDGTVEKSEESKQLGSYWLKWHARRSFESLELNPTAKPHASILNLWQGFAVEPVPGDWSTMRDHVINILANGNSEIAQYIFRFAAWKVQKPGERTEVALVLRGGKGSGKGTFATVLRNLFGTHGLHIFSSKHLIGNFNAHLRNCLLLYADEAFWAGDKQGESTLKGLITEPVLVIEQKGVDAVQWTNRLCIIMAANAEWVVPASHDERRYVVIDVASHKANDLSYFSSIRQQFGPNLDDPKALGAMLYDLQRVELGTWHPRQIIKTDALREQKIHSLNPLDEWFEDFLQSGILQGLSDNTISAAAILGHARDTVPKLKDVSAQRFGRYLRKAGALGVHTRHGTVWRMPDLGVLRDKWSENFGGWSWRNDLREWTEK